MVSALLQVCVTYQSSKRSTLTDTQDAWQMALADGNNVDYRDEARSVTSGAT